MNGETHQDGRTGSQVHRAMIWDGPEYPDTVWIDRSAAPGGNGTYEKPFNSYAAAQERGYSVDRMQFAVREPTDSWFQRVELVGGRPLRWAGTDPDEYFTLDDDGLQEGSARWRLHTVDLDRGTVHIRAPDRGPSWLEVLVGLGLVVAMCAALALGAHAGWFHR